VQTPPPSNVYDYDFGAPRDPLCRETAPGVFTRAWTKATVHFDCNSFAANITLAGQSSPGLTLQIRFCTTRVKQFSPVLVYW
jgi:hypothetical protein